MSLISILAQDKSIILYRKELNLITGSVTATILLQQMMYWWDKSGSKPFYKFIAPCGHDKYQDGDSWSEELGFTKREFSGAFLKLEELGLVSKRTNMDRVTKYSLNEDALHKALKRIYVNNKSAFTKTTKAHLELLSETTQETTHNSKSAEASDSTVKNTSYKPEDVINLFNETCSHVLPKCLALNAGRRRAIIKLSQLKLLSGNQPFIKHGLEAWETYFNQAIAIEWNVGKNDRGWKATIDYLLKDTNALKIMGI